MNKKILFGILLIIVVIFVGIFVSLNYNNQENANDVLQYSGDVNSYVSGENDISGDNDNREELKNDISGDNTQNELLSGDNNVSTEKIEPKSFKNQQEMINVLSAALKKASIEKFEIMEDGDFFGKRKVDDIESYFKSIDLDYSKINKIEDDKDLIYEEKFIAFSGEPFEDERELPQINIDSEYVKDLNEKIIEYSTWYVAWYGIDTIFNIDDEILSIMTSDYGEEATDVSTYHINVYTGEEVSNVYEKKFENVVNELRLIVGDENIQIYNEADYLNLILRVNVDNWWFNKVISIHK